MSKILQIFDHDIVTDKIKSVAKDLGLEYVYSENIEKAKQEINIDETELIFIMFSNAEDTFEDQFRQLQKEAKNIPIILVMGADEEQLYDIVLFREVVDYLNANIEINELREYIKYRLKKYKLIDKNTNIKLAIVDDSALELNIIKAMLEDSGLNNIKYFDTPEEVFECNEKFDIYIVDLVMPRISGRKLMIKIRKDNPSARIIAASALDNPQTVSNVLLSYADDYIIKPFKKELLRARLKTNIRSIVNLKDIAKKNQELEILNKKLEDMVVKDGLTEIYNHKYIYERLEKEIKLARRYRKTLSVCMFDIDYFKKINDEYGHQIGDQVLKFFSNFLRTELRDTDIIGRYGGEEFVIILPETSILDAYNTAERLRVGIEGMLIEKKIKITVSGGVAELLNEPNALELISKADMLLYIAKRGGRNRVEKSNSDVHYYGDLGGEA